MQLFVNPADELPIFRQLMRGIRESVAAGHLKPGDKLASHRELAEQLVIAPLTVKKAYDELEAEGFLETQRGRGTFVRERAAPPGGADIEPLKAIARDFVSRAYLAGLTRERMLEVLAEAEREMREPRETL
jgi:GntR family transcriptional regulator